MTSTVQRFISLRWGRLESPTVQLQDNILFVNHPVPRFNILVMKFYK